MPVPRFLSRRPAPRRSASRTSERKPDLYGSYVEVIVEWDQPRLFSAIFGPGNTPVTARAVARGKPGMRDVSILVLDPSAASALKVHRTNSVMTVPGAIVVNSSSGSALTVTGSGAAVVSQSEIDVTGGISGSNVYAPSQGVQTSVKTGQTPFPDPLASLPSPDPANMTVYSHYDNLGGTATINPGIYQAQLRQKRQPHRACHSHWWQRNGEDVPGSNKTLILTVPGGRGFNPGAGSVSSASGKDITAASMAVTSTTITVTLSVGSTANVDTLDPPVEQPQRRHGPADRPGAQPQRLLQPTRPLPRRTPLLAQVAP
jgi:hypothetical protein